MTWATPWIPRFVMFTHPTFKPRPKGDDEHPCLFQMGVTSRENCVHVIVLVSNNNFDLQGVWDKDLRDLRV